MTINSQVNDAVAETMTGGDAVLLQILVMRGRVTVMGGRMGASMMVTGGARAPLSVAATTA